MKQESNEGQKTKEAKPEAPSLPPTSPMSSAARVESPLSPHDGGSQLIVEKKDNLELAAAKPDDKSRIEVDNGSSKGTDDERVAPKEDEIDEEVVEKQNVMEKNTEAQTMVEEQNMAEEQKRGEERKMLKSASVQKTNSCHNHNICSCSHLLNDDRSAENNLSKICCCLKKTDQVHSEESKLLPELPGSSSCHLPESKFPVQEPTSSTSPKNSDTVSAEDHVDTGVRPPSSRQGSIVSSSPTIPSPSANETLPSWKVKFNRFRSTFLNAVTALTTTPPSKSSQSRAKFEVIDMSSDMSVVVKEMSYSAYAKKCQGDLSGGGLWMLRFMVFKGYRL